MHVRTYLFVLLAPHLLCFLTDRISTALKFHSGDPDRHAEYELNPTAQRSAPNSSAHPHASGDSARIHRIHRRRPSPSSPTASPTQRRHRRRSPTASLPHHAVDPSAAIAGLLHRVAHRRPRPPRRRPQRRHRRRSPTASLPHHAAIAVLPHHVADPAPPSPSSPTASMSDLRGGSDGSVGR
uniref:Uncharacterized protein n=1 Tax=Oryza glumipatula TaxID=40148 RepID=A0A0D9ZPA5_9ORYZ